MMNKLASVLLLFLFVFILSGIFLILRCNKNKRENFANEFYRKSIYSKVLGKEIEYKNHHVKIIRLYDIKKKKNWQIQVSTSGLTFYELWEKTSIGDTIIKEINSLSIQVIKEDKTNLNVLVKDYKGFIK